MFGILKNIKRLVLLIVFIALAFLVVNILAFYKIGSFYLFQKYPKLEKIEQVAEVAEKIQGEKKQEEEQAMLLKIDQLDIEAPIVSAESNKEADIQLALKDGVVLFPDTALPGEKGNAVIFGHSSDYFWRDGDYKAVFALLNRLKTGDKIKIMNGSKELVYKVENKKTVSKKDKTVLEQDEKESKLTLITCWPIGTDLKRLVVEARLAE